MTGRRPDKIRTLRLLRERDVPVGTVVDVGVCHGTPELMTVWPDRRHVLFEPVAEFAETISRNYRNIPHELHQVAVADETGTIGLKTAAVLPDMEIPHSSMTATSASGAGPASDLGMRLVPRVTLDGFLPERELEGPWLLKIDIDEQELKVLKGAIETLRNCSVVIVECQGMQLTQRIAAVQAAGFALFDLAEPCYYDKVCWQCDAVFISKDIAAAKFKQLQGTVEPGMYQTFRV